MSEELARRPADRREDWLVSSLTLAESYEKGEWRERVTGPLADLMAARDRLKASFEPMRSTDRAAAGLATLAALTKRRNENTDDMRAVAVAYLAVMRDFPETDAIAAMRAWPATEDGRWFPAWADLLAPIKARMEKRRRLLAMVEDSIRRTSHSEAPAIEAPKRVTPERAAEILARAGWKPDPKREMPGPAAPAPGMSEAQLGAMGIQGDEAKAYWAERLGVAAGTEGA